MELALHTRFVDSDDEDHAMQHVGTVPQPMQEAQAATTSISNPPVQFSLLSSISTDYDKNDQCYVLHLAHSNATGSIAAALSNRQIKLYSVKNGGIQYSGDLHGHTGRITSAQCPLLDEPHMLQTSSADGTVREWDLRTGQAARVYTAGNQEIACSSTNGTFVAAGARDNVLFWDRGSGKSIGSFVDTHFQDVSQLALHPTNRTALVSASEDGLIAVFDTSGGLDEDEGFRAALNIDTAVTNMGFYGPNGDKLWCCSGTETLHLWEWAAACDDESDGGNGPLGQSLDPRGKLLFGDQPADYLIECEYDPTNDQLVVAAGSISGTVALFPVEQPQRGAVVAPDLRFGGASAVLHGAHSDIVRSLIWLGGSGPLWVTGGEDARVCVWSSISGLAAVEPQQSISQGSSGEGASRHRGHIHNRRVSPY